MSLEIEEITLLFTDFEDIRDALGAAYLLCYARDLQDAQVKYTNVRPSPLTAELERVKARLDGYLGDYLLHQHEATLEGELPEEEDLVEEGEEGEGEELPDSPLGKFIQPRQEGRRLTPEEL